MRSARDALQLIAEEGWTSPTDYGSRINWCIHDALLQVARSHDDYLTAVGALSAEAGSDVMLWEREPGRTEEDVVALFERVLAR